MRTACVFVPSFTVAVERRADPRLEKRAVVVYHQNKVIDASPEADGPSLKAGASLPRGITLRQAKALAPHAVFLEANVSLYREVSSAMLDALERIAPLVEDAGLGIAYADIGGLDGHYTDEFELAGALVNAVHDATALLPSAGIADGKFVAWAAASASPPGDAGIVPPGRERDFLRDKPVALLPFGPELAQRLELLALPLLGDVAALPRTSVEAQFNGLGRGTGARLWELANGIDREPLRARRPDETLDERVNFESPVVATEALTMAARQIVARLVRRLRGRTARRMHVRLLADERVVWEKLETFREPAGDEARMLLLLKTRLATLQLPQSVDAVAITLSGIGWEVAKQTKLFTESKQNLDQIAEAVRQLRARYGRPVVWRIEEVDPWSRHPEERRALVPYDA
jgi:nucleotidyltransferase/DNA polymerase involved in DNA repair